MFLCDLDGYTRRSRRSLTLEQLEDLFRTFLLEVYLAVRARKHGYQRRNAGKKGAFCHA
jgi:hypothetical protein